MIGFSELVQTLFGYWMGTALVVAYLFIAVRKSWAPFR